MIFAGHENEGELFQVILTLAALHEALDEDVKSLLRTNSRRYDDFIAQPILLFFFSFSSDSCLYYSSGTTIRSATSNTIESIVTRGRALWDSIYAPHADKLHDKLGSYHPDLICEYTFPCFRYPPAIMGILTPSVDRSCEIDPVI